MAQLSPSLLFKFFHCVSISCWSNPFTLAFHHHSRLLINSYRLMQLSMEGICKHLVNLIIKFHLLTSKILVSMFPKSSPPLCQNIPMFSILYLIWCRTTYFILSSSLIFSSLSATNNFYRKLTLSK